MGFSGFAKVKPVWLSRALMAFVVIPILVTATILFFVPLYLAMIAIAAWNAAKEEAADSWNEHMVDLGSIYGDVFRLIFKREP